MNKPSKQVMALILQRLREQREQHPNMQWPKVRRDAAQLSAHYAYLTSSNLFANPVYRANNGEHDVIFLVKDYKAKLAQSGSINSTDLTVSLTEDDDTAHATGIVTHASTIVDLQRKIELLHGTRICDFFRRFLPERVVENYIEPHFADLHLLYAEAIARGKLSEAKKLKIYYYSRFALILCEAILSVLRRAFKAN